VDPLSGERPGKVVIHASHQDAGSVWLNAEARYPVRTAEMSGKRIGQCQGLGNGCGRMPDQGMDGTV